jgi:hypothetical protein
MSSKIFFHLARLIVDPFHHIKGLLMRILMLARDLPHATTADSSTTLPVLRFLANEHQVSLLAFAQNGHAATASRRDELQKLCQRIEVLPQCTGLFHVSFSLTASMTHGDSYLMRRTYSKRMETAVQRLLREERIDAIHLDHLSMAQYVPGYWQRPIILDERQSAWRDVARRAHESLYPARRWFLWREARRVRALEAAVCRRATVTIAGSEMERAALEQAIGTPWRIHIVPESVDLSAFESLWQQRAPEAGRLLTLAPGQDAATQRALTRFLTDVYAILSHHHPLLSLDTLTRAVLPWHVRSLPGLHIAPPDGANEALWRRAAVYLAPPLPQHQAQRGILGALAAGIPVVAHPAACDGLAVLEGEHLLMAQTPSDFAACIDWLSREVSHTQKLIMRGRRLIQERYDSSVAIEGLRTAYAHVVAATQGIDEKTGSISQASLAGGSRCVFCS